MGGLLFGYDSAVINGAVASIQGHFAISNFTLGVVVASALLGAAAGAMTAGRLADRIGRIAVMKIAAALCSSAPSVPVCDQCRIDRRVPRHRWHWVGVASVIAPAYIAEIVAAAHSWPSGFAATVGDVTGIFVRWRWTTVAHLPAVPPRSWAGHGGLALMFLMMAIPAIVRRVGVHDSRVAPVSRCQSSHSGSAEGADDVARREEPGDHAHPHSGHAQQ